MTNYMPLNGIKVLAAMLLSLTAPGLAQRVRFGGALGEPSVHNIPYDGRFTFARLKFTTGPGGYYYRGLPAWARPRCGDPVHRCWRQA